jgi:cyclopropane fatty-acyl-phospholipid synthase-like methyltransferase
MSFQHLQLSPRLAEIVDALPIRPGMRVLEIGGAPGAVARAIVERIPEVQVLVIDRSVKGVAQMERLAASEIAAGRMSVRCIAAEEFELAPGEPPYDLAFAVRVGALDGRHPRAGELVRGRMRAALVPGGKLLVDGGDPLREITLS